MSSQYKRFLQLLEKWPIDKTKPGRDLGQHLRDQVKSILGSANIIATKNEKLDKQFEALEILASNTHNNKYPRRHTSTATGLSAEQCNQVLSSEFLEYMNEEKSFFSKS